LWAIYLAVANVGIFTGSDIYLFVIDASVGIKWFSSEFEDKVEIAKLLQEKILEERKNRIEELAIEGVFDKKRFNKKVLEVENEIILKKIELEDLKKVRIDIESFTDYCRYFLLNLSDFWLNSDTGIKRRLQDFIFPEGIFIEEGKLRTTKIPTIFKVFEGKNDDESNLAAPRCEISNHFLNELNILKNFFK
jgi:hypothetical protein